MASAVHNDKENDNVLSVSSVNEGCRNGASPRAQGLCASRRAMIVGGENVKTPKLDLKRAPDQLLTHPPNHPYDGVAGA